MKDHWYLATTPSISLIISSPYGYNSWARITLEQIDPPVWIWKLLETGCVPKRRRCEQHICRWNHKKDTNPQLVGPNPIAFLLATHNVTEAVTFIRTLEIHFTVQIIDNCHLKAPSAIWFIHPFLDYRSEDSYHTTIQYPNFFHSSTTSKVCHESYNAVHTKSLLLCSKSLLAVTEFNILPHAFAESCSKSRTVNY